MTEVRMSICSLVLIRCLEWWFFIFPQFFYTLSSQFTFCFVSWQERIGMWAPPSMILNSYVRSMLGTCPHPLVRGVVAPGPLRKGFLIESLLALPDPPYSGKMTSFKVLGCWGLFPICGVERKGGSCWPVREFSDPLEMIPFLPHLPNQMIRGDLSLSRCWNPSLSASWVPSCINAIFKEIEEEE